MGKKALAGGKARDAETPRDISFSVALTGIALLGVAAVFTLLSLRPLPGSVANAILVFVFVFMGLGLLVSAAISRFLDNRRHDSEDLS